MRRECGIGEAGSTKVAKMAKLMRNIFQTDLAGRDFIVSLRTYSVLVIPLGEGFPGYFTSRGLALPVNKCSEGGGNTVTIQKLESVSCTIDDETGLVRENLGDGSFRSVHVTTLDPRWWEGLSAVDRQHLQEAANNMDRILNMEM